MQVASSAPYAKALNSIEEDEDASKPLGVLVYRSFWASCCCVSRTSRLGIAAAYPRYRGGRPDDFPSVIDIFLWGGISCLTEQACKTYQEDVSRSSIWIFVVCYIAFILPILTLSSLLDSGYSFAAFLAGVIACQTFVASLANRYFLTKLHTKMREAADDLAPDFLRIGYNLSYQVEAQFYNFVVVSFLQLEKVSHSAVIAHSDLPFQPLHSSPPTVSFRLTAFNSFMLCGGSRYWFDLRMAGYPEPVHPFINKWAWGALLETARPKAEPYFNRKIFVVVACLVWYQAVAMLEVNDDVWWPMFMVTSFGIFFLLWHPMEFLLARDLHDELRRSVGGLADAFEERSGYSVTYVRGEACSTSTHLRLDPVDTRKLERGATSV